MKHCDKLAVTVNPTNKCNLRCKYCMASSAEEQSNPIAISLDFAKKGIYDAINGYPTGHKATIVRFFSPGEPTQECGIMRECVQYARELKPDIEFELQTNGLFMSKADAEWIGKNFTVVWFSLDGPKSINDKWRPDANGNGRTDEIENNMKTVRKLGAFAGVRSTVVLEMFDHQDEMVEYYHNLGINYVCLNPIIRQIKRGDEGGQDVTVNDIMAFSVGFVKAYQKGKELGVTVVSSLTFNFNEKTCIACRSCVPMPQLNPDGSVSSCDMALYKDTKKELQCFLYGEWNAETGSIEYDQSKIKLLQSRNLENLPKCKQCEVKDYCAGGCAGRVAFQTGSMFDVIPEYCEAIKYLAKYIELGGEDILYTHP